MKKLKVFYNINQTAKVNESFSPSAIKPAEVLKSWLAQGLPIEVVDFTPATIEDFCLAHDREYVEGVMELTRSNGFSNTLPEVRDSLPYTTGSFVAAALHAASTGENAASLTSGFHHATHGNGGGFCTFNGLMVAAVKLHEAGYKRIGILDLDAHYGNGTDNIIEKLGIDYIEHYTFGSHHITPKNSDEWVESLEKILCNFAECDVILFQAGADPHINDPLGGSLTSGQMRSRDSIVFNTFKKMNIPVAWNLAGGYQEPLRKVLDIHDATAQECIKTFAKNGEEDEPNEK